MAQPLRLQLGSPIGSVKLLDRKELDRSAQAAERAKALKQQTEKISSLVAALQQAARQLEQMGRDIFVSHREQIVRLSVEIAARILAKDVQQRSYDIEAIILQALQGAPTAQKITIRLNPDDLTAWQQAASHEGLGEPENILCIGDWSVGSAECIIETDQGVVEYLIQEQLKLVAAALAAAETPVESAR
ncbi:MAG: hypothetical protein LLF76_15010 [Planctomycetaceae bacterium]|nr:hypothetical protein [Planctomycetaceae bacterium]